MGSHKTTAAEEMYLIVISMISSQNPNKPVSISSIAEELDVRPVSANQMIRKMAEEGWVEYVPYKGVFLTNRGSDRAERVLWSRRLWEVFLVKELGIPLERAEIIACDFEHHGSREVAERLDAFLDFPKFCYHGEIIPRKEDGKSQLNEFFPLSELDSNAEALVIDINTDAATLRFLKNEEIKPGVRIKIIAIGNYRDYLIESAGRRVYVSESIAEKILIRKESEV